MEFITDCYITDVDSKTVIKDNKGDKKEITYHNCNLRKYPNDFGYIRCGVKVPVDSLPIGKKVRATVDITTSWSGETDKKLFTHFNLVNIEEMYV